MGQVTLTTKNQMSSVLFGDTMVPNIEKDSILLLGYSILYKGYNLTGSNHQKNATQMEKNMDHELGTGFMMRHFRQYAFKHLGGDVLARFRKETLRVLGLLR